MTIDYENGTAHFSHNELLNEENINAMNAFFDARKLPIHYSLQDGIVYVKEGIYPIQKLEIS
jgi:hypothetical protein